MSKKAYLYEKGKKTLIEDKKKSSEELTKKSVKSKSPKPGSKDGES